jgi:murein DD-endopeptidase MepM/ murein hydrolase activator NlpD
MDDETQELPPAAPPPSGLRIRTLIIMVIIAAAVPIALVGWMEAWHSFLELTDPVIQFIDPPRGVGLTPAPVQIRIDDTGTGLSEVVVGIRQRDVYHELLHQKLKGEHTQNITLDLDGPRLGIDESLGPLSVEVHARDRAIWRNHAFSEMTFAVDFQKPKLELLSTRYAAKFGGSQMIIYRALDENLAVTGVKIAGHVFFGERASGIDSDLKDTGLYVAVFAVDRAGGDTADEARIFAEDHVGNAASLSIPLKAVSIPAERATAALDDDFMRSDISRLADQNLSRLKEIEGIAPNAELFKSVAATDERAIEKFKLIFGPLRMYNESEILSRLSTPRQESLWNGPFLFPAAKNQPGFGDELQYLYHDEPLGSLVQSGIETPARANTEVNAANDGIVILSDNIGVYGRVVGIDHGLGVVSIYGHLDSSSVKRGDSVTKGQAIGIAGKTGFARLRGVYYELRIQGVPVDPAEWGDPTWFYANVTAKVDEVRKQLGLPIYKPLH